MSHQVGRKARFNAALHFKASFQKKTREKRALVSQLCRVRARASSVRREESVGESDRERKLLDTSSTTLAGKQSGQSLSRVLKRKGFEGSLKKTRFEGL